MRSPNFIDQVSIYVKAGNGGAGSAHLHRAKNIPKGGPDGGDGGKGGDIFVVGNRNLTTLLHLYYKKHIVAPNGSNGQENRRHGTDGTPVTIHLPIGTVIKCADTERQILEVLDHNVKYLLAKAGRGGLGNDHFKTPTRQTPRYAQPGEPGQEMHLCIELKLLADVGLVGMPNAGKSTLLSVLTAAKPKIANYPFTTITPQLGVVAYEDGQSFVIADIPGIIEGASQGKGLGLQFLRHIQRNAVLLFLIPADSPDIIREYKMLITEVGTYNQHLLEKPKLLVISKADLLQECELKDVSQHVGNHVSHVFISAITQSGLNSLKHKLWHLIHQDTRLHDTFNTPIIKT